jgi:hypothetical protein
MGVAEGVIDVFEGGAGTKMIVDDDAALQPHGISPRASPTR